MSDPTQSALYEQTIRDAVERHFRETLGRPELLGRLGDNIVVFRPMQGQVAVDLANHFIDTALANVRRRVGNPVSIGDSARAALVAAITTTAALASGGRGITTALENRLVNPLGRTLFSIDPDTAVRISGVGLNSAGQPVLDIETS